MLDKHPTQIARTALFATLLGVAIPLAIQYLAGTNSAGKPNFSIGLLISNIAFILTSLNFFHGKVVSYEDNSYSRRLQSHPAMALADFWLNALLMLSFVAMAVSLHIPLGIALSNIAIRLIDIVLIWIMIKLTLSEEVRKTLQFWLLIDLAVILVFLGWVTSYSLWITRHPVALAPSSSWLFGTDSELCLACVFMTMVALDLGIDYVIGRSMYFSSTSSWGELADFWDAAQGDHGDIYRRAIINPALLQSIQEFNKNKVSAVPNTITGSALKVLDLGCGNGL